MKIGLPSIKKLYYTVSFKHVALWWKCPNYIQKDGHVSNVLFVCNKDLNVIFKSSHVTGGLVFGLFSPPLQVCQLSRTPEAKFFTPHTINPRVWEKFLVPISVTLGQSHQDTGAVQILPCPHDKVRTVHLIPTKNRYIPVDMHSTWLNFGALSETLRFFSYNLCNGTSRSNMEFTIYHLKMVSLPRNKKQTDRLNAMPQLRSSGLTLALTTLHF